MGHHPLTVPQPTGPTSVRWHIVALLVALCFVSHFNRVSISVAGNDRIMQQFSIEPTRMGAIYSAFLLVYSICMIPGGWFIDRFGPRLALMIVGFGSAVFGALTGLTGWLFSRGADLWLTLLLVRGAMGLLSAPLHPSSARTVGNWFPLSQRSWANGIVTGGAIAGVAATYHGFGALIQLFDWKSAFLVSAAITALLTWLWAVYATDSPAGHRGVNEAERGLTVSGAASTEANPAGWKRLACNRSLMLVTLSYAAVGYFQYLFVYWMQYYFDQVLRLGETASKLYASIPQIAMALTMPLGGWLSDRLARRTGLRRGRAIMAATGMILSAVLLGLGVLARDAGWIVAWFTLALGAVGASEGPFWATAVEIGGRQGGTAAAICNTGGNAGGMLAPVVTPWVSSQLGWPWGIGLGSLVCFLGALCWWGIDPQPQAPQPRAFQDPAHEPN